MHVNRILTWGVGRRGVGGGGTISEKEVQNGLDVCLPFVWQTLGFSTVIKHDLNNT